MKLIRTYKNGSSPTFPYNIRQLKTDFSNISFPRSLDSAELEKLGVYLVTETPVPSYNVYTERIVLRAEISDSGEWVEVWDVEQKKLSEDERAILFAEKTSAVKAEANRRILAILPEWKQRNYTARAVEKVAAGEVGDDEWNAMQAAWQQIKAVRVASDAIEAEINALTDEQAGQYDVSASPLWD